MGAEATQTELLERIKNLRTPTEPEGQPEEAGAVDVSVETPDVDSELQTDDIQNDEDQTDDELSNTEELAETLEGDEAAEESSGDDLVYEIGGRQITLKQLDELEKGQMKDADYTQKTQKLAEDRKGVQAQTEKQQEMLDNLQSHIDLVTEMLDGEFEGVDWDELRELDTGEYLKLKEKKEGKQGKLDAAKAKRSELLQSQRNEKASAEQAKLFDALPHWSDPVKKEADMVMLQTYLTDNKWSNEEFNDIINHKHMLTLLDAAKFHARKSTEAAITKKVKKAPVVIKGKKATATNLAKQIGDAQAKFKRTGKIEDAQVVMKLKRQQSK